MKYNYFFNDQLRWSLLWDNPNHAGAFLATLIPWLIFAGCISLFYAKKRSTASAKYSLFALSFTLFIFEIFSYYALVKTYSRGAIAGLLFGLVTVLVLFLRQHKITKETFVPISLRSVIFFAFIFTTTLSDRFSPDFVAGDKSVLNRFDIWKGALSLIHIDPFGWGWEQSGASFMNWTQPIDRHEGYFSVLNSWLTIAVELGLVFFFFILSFSIWIIFRGIRLSREESSPGKKWIILPALASLLAFFTASLFNNVLLRPSLWIVPGISLLVLLIIILRKRFSLKELSAAFTLSAICCIALYIGGSMQKTDCFIRKTDDGIFISNRDSDANTPLVSFASDSVIFGETYGKEIRRLVNQSPAPLCVFVYQDQSYIPPRDNAVTVLSGKYCSDEYIKLLDSPRYIFIHPTGNELPNASEKTILVMLPGIRTSASNHQLWHNWAERNNYPVVISKGVSYDIRPRFPELLLNELF